MDAQPPGAPMTTERLRVIKLAELPLDSNKAFKLAGRSVLLCRTAAGLFAVDNRCSHQLAPLEGGRLRGHYLFCPKHSARFDLRDGSPAGTLAKDRIQNFAVEVDAEGYIEVTMPARTGSASPQEESMNIEESNKKTVARFFELFSSGAVDETMAMFADDATWWVAGTMPISGTYDKTQFTALLGGVLDACTGPIRITPKAYTVQGERVAVEAESYTQTRNGRTYNNLYHFLVTVRDGRIAGVKEYLDTMHTQAVLCSP